MSVEDYNERVNFMNETFIFTIAFVLLCTLATVGLVLHYRLLSWLQKNHPEEWRQLGSPTLIANNSISGFFVLRKFLKNQYFQQMGDPELTKRSRAVWIFSNFYLLFFIFLLIGFMLLLAR